MCTLVNDSGETGDVSLNAFYVSLMPSSELKCDLEHTRGGFSAEVESNELHLLALL